jgi:hypothetical protein
LACCGMTFVDACEAAGGLLNTCNTMSCSTGVTAGSICQSTPPSTPGTFSCPGTQPCAIGSICSSWSPEQDGCTSQACLPPSGLFSNADLRLPQDAVPPRQRMLRERLRGRHELYDGRGRQRDRGHREPLLTAS